MALNLTGYKIFIASPGGLVMENLRSTTKGYIQWFNDVHANPRGVHFMPIMWEAIPGGNIRPQQKINLRIKECHYFLLLLFDRLGSPSHSAMTGNPISAIEEEFNEACEYCKDPKYPMKDILVLFKSIKAAKLSDPGEQLKRVLAFKQRLEDSKQIFFQTFDNKERFHYYLDVALREWLYEDFTGSDAALIRTTVPYSMATLALETIEHTGQGEVYDLLKEAQELADSGKLVEAETKFAQAVTSGESEAALNSFGNFLARVGRLEQAEEKYKQAITLSEKTGHDEARATAYGNLGLIYQIRGELDKAKEMYDRNLDLEKKLHRPKEEASDYRKLGLIAQLEGLLTSAEALYKQALEINKTASCQDGMADDYSLLGNIAQIRAEFDKAAEYYNHSLDINSRIQSKVGMANNYGNLGDICRLRGEFGKAEELHKKALTINTELGRKEGIANDIGNLGVIDELRGDLEAARIKFLQALKLEEELGHQEGIAKNSGRLGRLAMKQGNFEQAETLFRTSLALEDRLRHKEGLAKQYRNLGDLYRKRGQDKEAREMYSHSLKCFREIGAIHKMNEVRALLDEL